MGSTRRTRTLEERVRSYLRRKGVPGGARVLVAFSGGPDSRALLQVLVELAGSYPLELGAAHLDHGLRSQEERREEAAFVRRCCDLLGVALVQGRLRPGSLAARARREQRSLEETARQARYRFLKRALRSTGSRYLALGHNLDDHVETLVMRFFQGSGVAGLRGIRDARGRVLRPLREIPRSEIEGWLGERGLDYRVDSTNRDPAFLRNAVRHRLLPVAADIFPGHPGALERFSRLMRSVTSLLRSQARKELQWREEPHGWSIDSRGFFRAPYILRLESLYERIDRWGPAFRRIPERFFCVLSDAEGLQDRRVLLAGRGMILRRQGERLFLERDVVGGRKKGYFIRVRSRFAVVVSDAGLGFALRAEPGESPAGSLEESLVVRSAQAGDSIRTRGGRRAVRKLFGDWKIPHSERWRVPIVDSRSGILAVLGRPLGYADRFRDGLCEEMRSFLEGAVGVR